MYKKLFKNFVARNIKIFLLIFFSLSLSLFGYMFSDSLSKNFLENISEDSQINLGGDIVIDIGNKPEEYFSEKIGEILESLEIEIATEYSLPSSVDNGEILSSNILYFSENYPLYGDFEYITTGTNSGVIISQDLYNSLVSKEEIGIFGSKYQIYGIYNELPKTLNSFLSTENIFIKNQYFGDSIANETNAIINKKYFLTIKNPDNFDKYLSILEEKFTKREIKNYKNGGDRFEEIISNVTSYINYAVLFSFFLTVTIIFLSISSFFIKERKQLSILRILGMDNLKVYRFFGILFLTVFVFAFILAVVGNIILFEFVKTIELAQNFEFLNISIIKGAILGVILFLFSFSLPIIKLLSALPNVGLQDNFFNNLSKKEKIILGIFICILIIILGIFLGYSIITAIIIAIVLSVFFVIFGYFTTKLLQIFLKKSSSLRQKNFFIYDSIRSTVRPGNLSILLNFSFFIIFFITFFISILFGNFYNRLQVNLETDNNFFVLNITQDTFDEIEEKYKENAYSLLRGRIITINNKTLDQHVQGNSNGRFRREFNITDSGLQDLKILKGTPIVEGTVSVDDNFSRELGVDIGDEITFQIYGLEKKLRVINIRESQDYSINPFFYFQVDEQEFSKFPKQYFISDYVDSEDIPEVKKYFYNISSGTVNFIEVDALLEELKEISQKVLLVIQVLFGYIILFCFASIVVVGIFYKQFQAQKSYLYFMLGTLEQENKNRIFYEYLFLATFMFLFSIIIVTFGSYYLLSLNDFIDFGLGIYFQSFAMIFAIFIALLLGIYLFLTGKNQK